MRCRGLSTSKLKFILPDWDDIVDPGFDFMSEKHSPEYMLDKYDNGCRIWDIFVDSPLDGVLISRYLIDPPGNSREKRISKKYQKIKEKGLRGFLHLDKIEDKKPGFQIIGDCGAWQYIDQREPPYDPIETLEYYNEIGVDYGVSVDHIAIGPYAEERLRKSIENAIISYRFWKEKKEKGEYRFILLGSVQGIDLDTYIKTFNKLYDVGYRHFAIGGLAKRPTKFVARFIERLIEEIKHKEDIEKLHFLGIARLSTMKLLARLTEYVKDVSFDNATFLRMAWSRSLGNYLTPSGYLYTSIRIRIGSPKEYEVLEALEDYARRRISYEEIISILKEYVALTGDAKYLPYYARTLKDRPWEECKCEICSEHGIQVLIFRRNDRNRRRGFHNIWVFYKLLKENRLPDRFKLVKPIFDQHTYMDPISKYKVFNGLEIDLSKTFLIITNCTMEKNVDWRKVGIVLSKYGLPVPGFDLEREDEYRQALSGFIKPAHEMYRGTYRVVRRFKDELEKNGARVEVVIISARYGVIRSSDKIIPYEATLANLSMKEIREWSKRHGICEKLKSIVGGKDYGLIVVALPKNYFQALRPCAEELFDYPNTLIIAPTKIRVKRDKLIHASNSKKRIEMLSLLREYILYLLNRGRQKIIDEYINQ